MFNACATAASAIQQTADTIRLGKYDIGIAIGLDKHPRGAFTDDPAKLALPQWYAQNGQFVTTKFFGMKANKYLHDHNISQATLAKVAAKNFRNGALNPNAFRRKPISEDADPQLDGAELPADAVHVLRARRGCRGGDHVPRRHRAQVTPTSRCTCGPVEIRTRRYGAYEVHATFAPAGRGRLADGVRVQRRLRGRRHRPRGRRRRPAAGHRRRRRGDPHGRDRVCAPTASRRSWSPTAPPRSTARCRSTPTAG